MKLIKNVILSLIILSPILVVSADKGFEVGDAKAFKYAKERAESGQPASQVSLGNCYYVGQGVAKDYVEAVKWFRKAAEQGSAHAQYALGMCYVMGRGVKKDDIEAHAYYSLAASTFPMAAQNLAKLEKAMSPEAKMKGKARAKELRLEFETKIAAKKAGK